MKRTQRAHVVHVNGHVRIEYNWDGRRHDDGRAGARSVERLAADLRRRADRTTCGPSLCLEGLRSSDLRHCAHSQAARFFALYHKNQAPSLARLDRRHVVRVAATVQQRVARWHVHLCERRTRPAPGCSDSTRPASGCAPSNRTLQPSCSESSARLTVRSESSWCRRSPELARPSSQACTKSQTR